MSIKIQKATKMQARGRVALCGPSGHGKTYTSLILAKLLAGDGRFCVIDSERASASKYADEFDFDTIILENFSPKVYVDAIHAAEDAGYPVIVIDSLTHAWSGAGGALEQVDKAVARSNSKNSYAAWREVTPMHNALVDAMIQSSAHIIATMRVKTEYVIEEDERGRKAPRKVGLAPIQRDGLEYEFDLVADMNERKFVESKTRCRHYKGAVQLEPDAKFFEPFVKWLSDGAPAPAQPAPVAAPAVLPKVQLAEEVKAWSGVEKADLGDAVRQCVAAAGVEMDNGKLPDDKVSVVLEWVRERVRGGVGFTQAIGGVAT